MSDARALYDALLDAWNRCNADQFAELFADDGVAIGFDGTEMAGREAIRTQLAAIFRDHPTAAYVSKVRDVRDLGGDATVLRAVAGMIPRGGNDLIPDRNAVQTLIARAGLIVLFQNTPAAYHGRPEAVEELTSELRELLPR